LGLHRPPRTPGLHMGCTPSCLFEQRSLARTAHMVSMLRRTCGGATHEPDDGTSDLVSLASSRLTLSTAGDQ
jgi:hypothetical protein